MTDLIRVGSFKGDHTHADDMYDGGKKINDFATSVLSRLSQTINAGDVKFAGGATDEARIQLAVNQAVLELAPRVFIPASMLPFDVTLLDLTAFNAAGGRLVWEGGDWTVYDVRAYGADADGGLDAGLSWNAARAACPSGGGEVLITNGTYKLTTAFTFAGRTSITVRIDAGVTLTGANATLPAVTGASPISPDFNAYLDMRGGTFTLTNRLRFVTNALPNAPTMVDHVETVFNGTVDPAIYIGYNMTGYGSLVVSTEPGAAWAVEGNYNDGSGQNKMEAYLQFVATDGVYQRPYFASYNRVTKLATPFISGDQIFFSRSFPSVGVPGDEMGYFQNDGVNGNNFRVSPATYANASYAIVDGRAGTRAGVLFGLIGGTRAQITTDTALRVDYRVNGRESAHMYASMQGGAGAGDGFAVGADDSTAVGVFNNTGPVGVKGVVVRGKSGQTAALFEAQDNNSNSLWSITAAGLMKIGANQVVGARVTGYAAMTGTPNKGTVYDTATVTLAQLAGRVMQLQADVTTHGLIGA